MDKAPRILALFGGGVVFGQERANVAALEALRDSGCSVLCLARDEPWARETTHRYLTMRGLDFRPVPFLQNRVPGALFSFYVLNVGRFLRSKSVFKSLNRTFNATHVHVANPLHVLPFLFSIERSRVSLIYRAGDKPLVHNAFWRWLWKRIVARADHFVAISEFVARELRAAGVPQSKISVIYNIPPQRSDPPMPKRHPTNSRHILFIGQIAPHKGVDVLLEAFARIAQAFPDARLSVIGRTSEWSGDAWARSVRNRALADARISGRVFFLGEREDIYEHLAEASFLVCPSVFDEPLSNVVGEAKAAARPAVIFPRGGLPELVQHGVDGYICADITVEALMEGLKHYLETPERAVEDGARALCSIDRLGMHSFSQRWREIYDRTMPAPTDMSEEA